MNIIFVIRFLLTDFVFSRNMHSQLVIVLLVGLAASSYALDLSHANKRSPVDEPRLFEILSDLYATVIYPPLNHIVTS